MRRVFDSIVVFITCFLMMAILIAALSANSGPKNTIARTKLDSSVAYDNNCVEDQLGWIENANKVSSGLKKFWQETGVQPYILLKADDGTLTTDEEKQEWATWYYDTYIGREDGFLYVYFYENGEEYNEYPSMMAYANGYQASSVMDSMAVEIFWGYIDRYWPTDMSMDDVFISAFTDTGNVIMKVSTTGKDIVKWVIIAVILIAICITLLLLSKVWFKDRREKAKEDKEILSTPLERASMSSDLEDKYLD